MDLPIFQKYQSRFNDQQYFSQATEPSLIEEITENLLIPLDLANFVANSVEETYVVFENLQTN